MGQFPKQHWDLNCFILESKNLRSEPHLRSGRSIDDIALLKCCACDGMWLLNIVQHKQTKVKTEWYVLSIVMNIKVLTSYLVFIIRVHWEKGTFGHLINNCVGQLWILVIPIYINLGSATLYNSSSKFIESPKKNITATFTLKQITNVKWLPFLCGIIWLEWAPKHMFPRRCGANWHQCFCLSSFIRGCQGCFDFACQIAVHKGGTVGTFHVVQADFLLTPRIKFKYNNVSRAHNLYPQTMPNKKQQIIC